MEEDFEFVLPKRKAKSKQPYLPVPSPNPVQMEVHLDNVVKDDFNRIVKAIEKNKVAPPDVQEIRGSVSLEDKQVEIDLSQVLQALKRIEEASPSVTVKNQPQKELKELRTAIIQAIKNAPEVVVNNPDEITIANKKPSEAIPVTLTDKAQKKFVEAITNVISQPGGGGGWDTSALQVLLEDIKQNTADIEIKAESINLNTDTLEAKLTDGSQKSKLVDANGVTAVFGPNGQQYVTSMPLTTRMAVDSVTSTTSYIGKASPGTASSAASWQISKLDESSGTVLTWANGSNSFNAIWNNRESLSYS